MPFTACPCGPAPSACRGVLFHLMFHTRPGGAPLMRGAHHCGGATLSRREQPTPAVLPAPGCERTPSHSPPPASTHPRRPARAVPRPLPFVTPPSPWPSASAIRHSRPLSRTLAATPPPPAAVLLRGPPARASSFAFPTARDVPARPVAHADNHLCEVTPYYWLRRALASATQAILDNDYDTRPRTGNYHPPSQRAFAPNTQQGE